MSSAMWIIASVLVAAFLIMIPVQYRYIAALKKDPRRQGVDQETYYNNMSFQEEQLHYNTQGWFWPSTMVASLIYNWRHKSGKMTK
ncbi:DUF3949 domain-containing protein [Paenibacillus sp. MDMC362]|uniref:DUF3949 domain-containing protein n=1 Tax=Paenibacillus sp. MDMC362 TaxID=2977365 RepID=UPI000DC2BA0E|nr:DUF3949 domain-containing protein [Paenibacillus sp. MDMC362]RAR42689.1 hypothetical protein DP091_17665 [Paenibacillus sp. MDMC362]